MKKHTTSILLLTSLFCSPSFSTDLHENDFTSWHKTKSSHKHVTQLMESEPGWYSRDGKIKINYTDAKEIGDFAGGKLYGYIDPSLDDSQWQKALDKGFAKTAKGHNGVKLINNSLLELKINGDARLYTTEVHKNDQGNFIAIFNDQAGHKKISKMANKSSLKIHADCFLQNPVKTVSKSNVH